MFSHFMTTSRSPSKTLKHTLFNSLLACTATITLSACVSTTQEGASGVNRKQLMLVSSAEVNSLSLQSYQQDAQKAKQSGNLDKSPAQLKRLQNIANRLIPQVAFFRPEAKQWQWEVHLITSDELNAYCAPGGKIMFYTGIIDRLNLTDDEIAAIMGHEMSHALREHGRERMSRAMAQQTGLGILAATVGFSTGQAQAIGLATQLGLDLPFSRGQESEADSLGLELMARAGYNPQQAVSLWKKMDAANKNAPPQFLSTHPAAYNRINNLQSLLPKMTPLYMRALPTLQVTPYKPVK